jgi:membrane protease YdiL (CAAX protease family)
VGSSGGGRATNGRTAATVIPDAAAPAATGPPQPVVVSLEPTTRTVLVWETRFVMLAFLAPAVTGAIVLLAQHVNGVGSVTRFPVILKGNPVWNLVIGILAYLPVAAIAPLALSLLSRTGQSPRWLGLGLPSFKKDIWPAVGLAAAAFGSEILLAIPLAAILTKHSSLFSNAPVGKVPAYYVMYGIAIAAATSVAEEVLVNGYLLTRLHQLGWSPGRALTLSLALRTSYHIYYGLGFIFTVPFGYYVTRSFQKNGRLTRPIVAHFLFDAVVITIAILA